MRPAGYGVSIALLAVPVLVAGQTADQIMERVADNQARSESSRSTTIYTQDVRTRFLKGRGKVSREEEHRFTVAPARTASRRHERTSAGLCGTKES